MSTTIKEINDIEVMLEYATDIYSNKNKANYFYSDSMTDLQCGIYVDDYSKKVTASFRGTTSHEDRLTDLDIAQTKYVGNIRVHSGFYDQLFKSCVYQDFCNKFIEIVGSNSYSVYITGHSLGAALASLFGFRMANTLDRKINIVTFASPKVGNYYWKQAFDSNCNIKNIRVMVSSDPIPLTPIINYYHVANVLCLSSGKYLWYIEDHSTKMYKKLILQKKLDVEYNNTPPVPVPCNIGRKQRKNRYKCSNCGRKGNYFCCSMDTRDVHDPSAQKNHHIKTEKLD